MEDKAIDPIPLQVQRVYKLYVSHQWLSSPRFILVNVAVSYDVASEVTHGRILVALEYDLGQELCRTAQFDKNFDVFFGH